MTPVTQISTPRPFSLYWGNRRRLSAGPELLILLLQPAEERRGFFGPIAQEFRGLLGDCPEKVIRIGSRQLIRLRCSDVVTGAFAFHSLEAFAVQFLAPRQSFTQAAPLGDQFAHYAFPGFVVARLFPLDLLQPFAAAVLLDEFPQLCRIASEARSEEAHSQKESDGNDKGRSDRCVHDGSPHAPSRGKQTGHTEIMYRNAAPPRRSGGGADGA
jgi:hypothetical protein